MAAASITSATGRSRKATKPKISTGVSAATKSWGRYWPKYVSSCWMPSTSESITSAVRAPEKWAGPSATMWS